MFDTQINVLMSTYGGISKIATKTLGVRDDESVSYTIR
jgi:hypothetical protein